MTRPPPISTYDDDFFAWTQEQAAALRQMSRDGVVDIEHVAEEIEDLGKRDLREVESYLARIFEHLIEIDNFATSVDAPHWRAEVRTFQDAALRAFSPNMLQLIDLPSIWRRARKRSSDYFGDIGATMLAPAHCPFMIDDLSSDDFAIERALTKLRAPA